VIFVTILKMADEHQDEREATFIFIEAVQNRPTVWDVSSAKINKSSWEQA